jgi:hypothetical protein
MDASLTSWPGLGERPSSSLIALGRDLGRLRAARPADIANVRHGRPGLQESGRQRVPEDLGALTRRFKPGALQCAPHKRPDRD